MTTGSGEKRVDVNSIRHSYMGKIALQDVTFSLLEGQIVGLLGPNGAGKSTLLRILAGLLKPESGHVFIEGKAPQYARGNLSYFGEKEDIYPWMTPADAKKLFSGVFADFSHERFSQLTDALKVPVSEFSKMSRGQKARFKLCLVLARRARLFLLDEPLSGIDIISREEIIKAIVSVWDKKGVLILSTHEFEGVDSLFDHLLLLREGVLIGNRSADSLRADGLSTVDYYRGTYT